MPTPKAMASPLLPAPQAAAARLTPAGVVLQGAGVNAPGAEGAQLLDGYVCLTPAAQPHLWQQPQQQLVGSMPATCKEVPLLDARQIAGGIVANTAHAGHAVQMPDC